MAPVPDYLAQLLMTESNEYLLEKCIDNLERASFPESKVGVGTLNWNKRVPDDLRNQCDFIMSCDNVNSFPVVNPLARVVADALKKRVYDESMGGSFVYVTPTDRECITNLQLKFAKEYLMTTDEKEMIVERFALVPLVMDSLYDAEEQMKIEVDDRSAGYVEYEELDTRSYSALVVRHDRDLEWEENAVEDSFLKRRLDENGIDVRAPYRDSSPTNRRIADIPGQSRAVGTNGYSGSSRDRDASRSRSSYGNTRSGLSVSGNRGSGGDGNVKWS